MGKVDGKVALTTGATEGVGFETAKGAFVFITGRRIEEVRKAEAKLGEQAHGMAADSAKVQDIERMFSEIKASKGKLDVVFANAGVYKQVPWNEIAEKASDQTFSVNVKGIFFCPQKAIPLMEENGSISLNGYFIGSSGT